MCKEVADEQLNSQSSQLDEENLNELEEAVSENNACSSSMQSGEVLECLFVVNKRNSLVRSGNYAKLSVHKL